MPPIVNLIVLRTAKFEAMLKFYAALGLNFVEEKHGSGPVHFSTELGGVILEIYPGEDGNALDRKISGATMIGLRVDSIDETLSRLSELGIIPLSPPKDSVWGRRAVVLDPDGRAIELSENRD